MNPQISRRLPCGSGQVEQLLGVRVGDQLPGFVVERVLFEERPHPCVVDAVAVVLRPEDVFFFTSVNGAR